MHPLILFTALLSGAILVAAPSAVFAQHAAHPSAAPERATPYAGLQGREIKALSPQQVADLREGKGMSLALAGELNGFPGPSHVLEMADALGLSAEQRVTTQQLLEQMKTQARTLGAEVIAAEGRLDALFGGISDSVQMIRLGHEGKPVPHMPSAAWRSPRPASRGTDWESPTR